MDSAKEKKSDEMIGKAALAAIVIGAVATLILVYEASSESYSSLYLKPDSYGSYIKGDTASFSYGVQCFENKRTEYDLKVFLNETQVAQKQFSIEGKGQTLEESLSFIVPHDTVFPVRVSVRLAADDKTYSTHYWLRGRK
jgi:hypothetical protein